MPSLPLVHPLPDDFSLADAFSRLCHLPHCLWLDSASSTVRPGSRAAPENHPRSPALDPVGRLGRYSFLTADPVRTLVAAVGEANPWPLLQQQCRALPSSFAPDLPPFQGGLAGLWGYEAATWLEPVGMAAIDDLPTPALSVGLYDWTLATDHQQQRSWLISQGLGGESESERHQRAEARMQTVLGWLTNDPPVTAARPSPATPAVVQHQTPTHRPEIQSNLSSAQFRQCIQEIVHSIYAGDSFQVNFAQRLLSRAHSDSPELFLRLRDHNPAPFAAFYGGDGFEVLSSSPEGFLKIREGIVETRPIKGTAPRTGDAARDQHLAEHLAASEKDRAENVMIVDLMRNDLSRVCEDDSVHVTQLCEVERYQYVQHLVSAVQGKLRTENNAVDLLQACFPGGSVTGAPKIEAMRTIARLEPHRRGPYCGSIGYISCGGSADFNILIRTITATQGYWQIPVGGGITARSEPASEEAETWDKAEGMLRATTSKS